MMPRFIAMIRTTEEDNLSSQITPDFGDRMGAVLDEMTKAGVMLDTAGLTPTADGTRVTWSGGNFAYVDGPFTETKEVVGGYIILQAKNEAEALEWAKRFLEIHPVAWTVTVEVRQLIEA
jgi:hypothetical protein